MAALPGANLIGKFVDVVVWIEGFPHIPDPRVSWLQSFAGKARIMPVLNKLKPVQFDPLYSLVGAFWTLAERPSQQARRT